MGAQGLLKRQLRRRRKMHPTRRNQETLALITGVAAVFFFVVGAVLSAIIVAPVAAFLLLVSRAEAPNKRQRYSRKQVPTGQFKVLPWQSPGKAMGLKPCGARCQYSKKPVSTCRCSCLGKSHGSRS